MSRITIGIPSYNEERNIVNLLKSLEENPLISEVIISDDSIDLTPTLVRDFSTESRLRITLYHHESRRGAAAAWNEIFHKATGDIIVLYDADIIPHPSCTEQLSSRILGKTALCASNSQPIQARGIAGKATVFISNWLRGVRRSRLSQYTMMGRALAIDAAVARKLLIPADIIAIDLYVQCKVLELGLHVTYNDSALVYFRPPGTIQDLASQVTRAVNGHNQIKDVVPRLGPDLPPYIGAFEALKNAIREPVGAVSTILAYSVIPYYKSRLEHTNSAKWHTATSSKEINYQQLKASF